MPWPRSATSSWQHSSVELKRTWPIGEEPRAVAGTLARLDGAAQVRARCRVPRNARPPGFGPVQGLEQPGQAGADCRFSGRRTRADHRALRLTLPGPGLADPGQPAAAQAPESFDWLADATDPNSGVLQVGDGRSGPVSKAVWAFSVSGYAVLKGWLALRMKARSGRKSSPLDDIRPERWDATLSQELRELIWVLEATVDLQPQLNALLAQIVAGPVLRADELPLPAAHERLAPGDDVDASPQHQLTDELRHQRSRFGAHLKRPEPRPAIRGGGPAL